MIDCSSDWWSSDLFQCLEIVLGRAIGPWRDRTPAQAAALIRDDQHGVEDQLAAEPVAGRTCTERVVEREEPRLDLVDRKAGNRTRELSRVGNRKSYG